MSDIQDAVTGWNFTETQTKKTGLALTNLRHHHHLLSPDVRVVGLWVGTASGTPPATEVVIKNKRSLLLGSDDLPPDDAAPITLPSKSGLIAPFNPPLNRVVTYRTKGPVLGDDKSAKLGIEQRYMFTAYGIDPPHEPGQLVWGARMYPLISFDYPASPKDAPAFNYIRVDLRMAVGIEAVEFGSNTATFFGTGQENLNQAGLFRDGEKVSQFQIESIFERIDKPLKWEILSLGLDWNAPPLKFENWNVFSANDQFNVAGVGAYDNIHQWPKAEGLPVTPGAAHAAHIHWRWGYAATEKGIIAKAAGPQFEGWKGPSTALVDGRIPIQRLAVAITRFDPRRRDPQAWAPNADQPATRDLFSSLFSEGRKNPEPIESGAPLVWWLSAEAIRDPADRGPWQGTFFAHGMFFTHSAMPGALKALQGELSKSSYKNAKEQQRWWRPDYPKFPV